MRASRILIAALLSLSLFAASCGDSDSTESSPVDASEPEVTGDEAPEPEVTGDEAPEPEVESDPEPVAVPLGTAGCGAEMEVGTTERQIDTTDGLTRDYRLHIPASYDPTRPTPLILAWHGADQPRDEWWAWARFDTLPEAQGFISVAPLGLAGGTFQSMFNAEEMGDAADDVAFTHQLLDRLEADLCIDVARVYSVGHSNGGSMSAKLACVMPERITAIAAATGLIGATECGASEPVPVLLVAGSADPLVPLDFLSGAAAEWVVHNGCAADAEVVAVSGEVERRTWDCPDDAAVEMYVVEGGGHAYPPYAPPAFLDLGYATQDIDTSLIALDWFETHAG